VSSSENNSTGPLIAIALAVSLLLYFAGGGEEGLVEVNYNRSLILMDEGKFDEAKLLLEEVLRESEEHLDALREHARMLVLTSDGVEDEQLMLAIAQVDRVLALEPRNWQAFEVLGDAHLAQANPVSAVAAYVEAAFHGERREHIGDKYRGAVAMARERFGTGVELAEFR
jgi:tetratricopeptide (TPR) repeat protein